MGICARHWPSDFRRQKSTGGFFVPCEPPSVFPDELKSLIPNPLPSERSTHRAITSARNPRIDEMPNYLAADQIDYNEFAENANVFAEEHSCVYFTDSKEHLFHSLMHNGPICDWKICITESSVKFYRGLQRVKIPYVHHGDKSNFGRNYMSVFVLFKTIPILLRAIE